MRILLLIDCYYPSAKAGAKLIHDLGVELHRRGHAVTILTPSEHNRRALELCLEDNLQVARIKTGQLKGAAKVWGALREIRLSETLWRGGQDFLRANPHDLIVFYSPSIFFGPLVQRLKKLWDCPAYLILRDIFPQWAVDAGVLREGLLCGYFRRQERAQYAAADVIGVQSPANLQYFAQQPKGTHHLEVLYNWTVPDEAPRPGFAQRRALGWQDKVVFFYGGNLGVAQDPDNLVRLAQGLRADERARVLLVGEGSEAARLQGRIQAERLDNLRLLPAVGQAEYLALLAEFDVGLVSLERKLRTSNFPGKILGYMSCAKPLLCSLNPGNDLQTMLETYGAGLCALNGDDAALHAHALRLVQDTVGRRRMGQQARLLLDRYFSVGSVAGQILSHFTTELMFTPAARQHLVPALRVG